MKKLPLIILSFIMTNALFAQQVTELPAQAKNAMSFHSFSWGTSLDAFKARMGNPAHVEEASGFQSLIYENVPLAGFRAFMVAYFSKSGLEGGAYYFNTNNLTELMSCYESVQKELVALLGPPPPPPAGRYEQLLREMRTYETCWNLPEGFVHLKVNTRRNDPVTLWISFPTLTAILDQS